MVPRKVQLKTQKTDFSLKTPSNIVQPRSNIVRLVRLEPNCALHGGWGWVEAIGKGVGVNRSHYLKVPVHLKQYSVESASSHSELKLIINPVTMKKHAVIKFLEVRLTEPLWGHFFSLIGVIDLIFETSDATFLALRKGRLEKLRKGRLVKLRKGREEKGKKDWASLGKGREEKGGLFQCIHVV